MGHEWLTRTENRLREGGFRVEYGYPAEKAAHLTDTVAAVTAEAAWGGRISGLLVSVLTPGKLGLAQCQNRALEGLRILGEAEGQWRLAGWRYEPGIDCWIVELRGTAGCRVLLADVPAAYVTDFLACQEQERRLIRPHAQGNPSGITSGRGGWKLKLTQLLPEDGIEPERGTEPFTLVVKRGGRQECGWDSCSVRHEPEGIRIERTGFALDREVVYGTDEV